jgi:hypothetical protein
VAIGVAVLRYRLYDLAASSAPRWPTDCSRFCWGAVTGTVLGLAQLMGRTSRVAVAAVTLMVAALFRPASCRIQTMVDRRFSRRRYDAALTIAAFSGRLRQQVDLDP